MGSDKDDSDDPKTEYVDLALLQSSLRRSVEARLRTNMSAVNAAIELRNAFNAK